MKKLILLLLLVIISTITFAQHLKYESTTVELTKYDKATDEFVSINTKEVKTSFDLDKGILTIDTYDKIFHLQFTTTKPAVMSQGNIKVTVYEVIDIEKHKELFAIKEISSKIVSFSVANDEYMIIYDNIKEIE